MNNVVLTGNIVRDAVLRETTTGKQVCDVRFAVREDRKPDSVETTFVDLTIWGERAEKLAPHLTRGKALAVSGRLEIRTNTKGDKTYKDVKVVVNELEFLSKKEKGVSSATGAEEVPF
ncbi:MAG: single-stranded DNA-binding protein [Candidatus Edwardsbacteria bacterium]